jgi:putative oxidoreductase
MANKNILLWGLRITAAIIIFQTLYYKFSGHPESVTLFTKLGVEPWGRIGTGIIELITGVLLLLPATSIIGALLGIGLMLGAIFSHITVIGIASNGDGGQLFILAIVVLLCCLIYFFIKKQDAIVLVNKIFRNNYY